MSNAAELDELRDLQARAYGRGGGLTDTEAARLRELQGGSAPSVVPEPAEPAAHEASTHAHAPAEDPPPAEETAAAQADAPEDSGASAPALLRARWRPLALVAAALLIAGLGIGALLARPAGEPVVALTSEQQEWHDLLVAEGEYDPGSVRTIAVQHDVVMWTATKQASKYTCLIFGHDGGRTPTCNDTESVAESGIWGSIVVESDGKVSREIAAQLLFTASGQPAIAVSHHEQYLGSTGITYANAIETQIAEGLVDQGFDAQTLWVAGYDGDVPIWMGQQAESLEQCLVYDGSVEPVNMVCSDPQTFGERDAALVLTVVDAQSGATTTFEMAWGSGPSYLVITREGGGIGAARG